MQARISAVDDVDVAPLISLDIVRLNRRLAALLALSADAPRVGRLRDRRDEIADLFGMIGIAYIERPHAGVEE